MDLLSLFRGSPEKQITRARKKVKEPHGDPATRMNAAHKLYEMETPEAILALLDRFTISSSPSNQDEEEKQEVLSWIVAMGERSVAPLIQFVRRERQVYWPVKALEKVLSREEFAARMSEVLRDHWENPPASSDPTAQLIRLLGGTQSEELVGTVRLFLESQADDIRLAALDHLLELPQEQVRESILECYLRSEDRPRVRGHILERFAEEEWTVKGFRPKIVETLPEGYALTRDGLVKTIRSIL